MSINKKTLKQAQNYVLKVLKAGLTPYISGSPGLGKSAMIAKVAKQYNLKLIDIRLTQEDPTGLQGFPNLNNNRSEYMPPKVFPLQGIDNIPEEYSGWLLFFDELPSAPRATLSACYKIILDRMIGEYALHEKCLIATAGNLMDDGAIVNEMGTALRSRLIHIQIESNPKEYLDFATQSGYDFRIVSYLAYQNSKINTFNVYKSMSTTDETFCCERTWEFVNKLLPQIEPDSTKPIPKEYTDLLVGTIGSTAHEFVAFTEAFKELPTFNSIIANPKTVIIPSSSSVNFLLMGMLVSNADMNNIDSIMDYVSRLSKEYGFIFLKMLWSKDARFIENEKVETLFNEVGDILLS